MSADYICAFFAEDLETTVKRKSRIFTGEFYIWKNVMQLNLIPLITVRQFRIIIDIYQHLTSNDRSIRKEMMCHWQIEDALVWRLDQKGSHNEKHQTTGSICSTVTSEAIWHFCSTISATISWKIPWRAFLLLQSSQVNNHYCILRNVERKLSKLRNSASSIWFQLYLKYIDKVYGTLSKDDWCPIPLGVTELIRSLSPDKKDNTEFPLHWWNYIWSARGMSVKRLGGSLAYPGFYFCNRCWKLHGEVTSNGCMGDTRFKWKTTTQKIGHLLWQSKSVSWNNEILLWQFFDNKVDCHQQDPIPTQQLWHKIIWGFKQCWWWVKNRMFLIGFFSIWSSLVQ